MMQYATHWERQQQVQLGNNTGRNGMQYGIDDKRNSIEYRIPIESSTTGTQKWGTN